MARGQVYYRDDCGVGSSHQAEWEALLHALQIAADLKAEDILLLGDSKAVIDQANRCSAPGEEPGSEMEQRHRQAMLPFAKVRLRYIKRNQNLAGIALAQARQGVISHPRPTSAGRMQAGVK